MHLAGDSPEELADDARRRLAEGYTAVRFYPLGQFNGGLFGDASYTAIARIVEDRVSAVREAVGPDIDVMIDVVNRLTPPEALLVARACAPYNLYFFEDPLEPDSMEAQAAFTSRSPVPVATGERLTRESFVRYRAQGGPVISHVRTEEMTLAAITHPIVMIASDGGTGHPRGAGTFSKLRPPLPTGG